MNIYQVAKFNVGWNICWGNSNETVLRLSRSFFKTRRRNWRRREAKTMFLGITRSHGNHFHILCLFFGYLDDSGYIDLSVVYIEQKHGKNPY